MSGRNWLCRCGALLRPDRLLCRSCGAAVVYDPDTGLLRDMHDGDRERLCPHRPWRELRCNWLAYAPGQPCYACELTATVPPLDRPGNRGALRRFENAKRRLLTALLRLQLLPRHGLAPGGHRLRFHLKQDQRDNPAVTEPAVLTGHADGDITLNTRETDRVIVEATRRQFGEQYRTLLGTLRHEVGHYFFLALIAPDPGRLARFRGLFGDERADYAAALAAHHAAPAGPQASERNPPPEYVSHYAQVHPHEDWAETWAHFMHMEDALAVAGWLGPEPAGPVVDAMGDHFTEMVGRWDRLTVFANAINLSMGHAPAYPFKLTQAVRHKMRFVAEVIAASAAAVPVPEPVALAAH